MKKYIILTPEVGSMGGSQMFVANKAEYLLKQGWNVTICYFRKSEVLISKYHQLHTIYLPFMAWGVPYYSKRTVDKYIAQTITAIGSVQADEIVVESMLCHLSFWGELLSACIGAKHALNFLEEDIPVFPESEADYFEFKLKRGECINASIASLKRLFKKYYKEDYARYEHKTKYSCSNVLEDDNIGFELPKRSDINIISIGRLDKPYIPEMVNGIAHFIECNASSTYSLIFVGGSPNGEVEEKILSKFASYKNVTLHFMGYLFPIPTPLVKIADVAIATSNSVLVSHNLGVPTVAMDALDNAPIGIYGFDTSNTVFRKGEPIRPLENYLEEMLCNSDNYNAIVKKITSDTQQENDDSIEEQVRFVVENKIPNKYYDVNKTIGLDYRLVCMLKHFYVYLKKNK